MPASFNPSDAKLTRSSILPILPASRPIISAVVPAKVESPEKRSRDEPSRTDRRPRALFSAEFPRSGREARPQPRLRVQDGRGQGPAVQARPSDDGACGGEVRGPGRPARSDGRTRCRGSRLVAVAADGVLGRWRAGSAHQRDLQRCARPGARAASDATGRPRDAADARARARAEGGGARRETARLARLLYSHPDSWEGSVPRFVPARL